MFVNLTPHSVEVYAEDQFTGLEQQNPTTWIADGVVGGPIASFPSAGSLRIATSTVAADPVDSIPLVATAYGALTGVPENLVDDDLMIVSLPAQSMAKKIRA